MHRITSMITLLLLLGVVACSPTPGGDAADGGADGGLDPIEGADAGEDGGTTAVPTRTTATIGPEGGVLELDGATLTFQVGSLPEVLAIELEHDPAGGPADAFGGSWRIGPINQVLVSRAELRIPLPAEADDPALFWSRYPDFGTGVDRLDAWREGDALVAEIPYLGTGFVAPADDRGVVVYESSGRVEDLLGGVEVTLDLPETGYTWRASGGGGTSSGLVETSDAGLSRYGPLHPAATHHALCLDDPDFCLTLELGMRDDAWIVPGRAAERTTSRLSVEASNLAPMTTDARYRFVSQGTVDVHEISAADLIDSGTAAVGDVSTTLPFEPRYELDPVQGDRGWLFEYTAHSMGDVDVRVLSGYDALLDLAIPAEGPRLTTTAAMTPVTADDVFTLHLDTAAWAARVPALTEVRVSLYGTWGTWAPWEENGAALAVVTAPLADLGTPMEIAVPSSPVPEWDERVYLSAGGVHWELPRSEVDGQVLPAPPLGPPTGLTFNGTPASKASYAELTPGSDVVVEWDAAEADVEVEYLVRCYLSDYYSGATVRRNFVSLSTRVVLESAEIEPLDFPYGYCTVSASERAAPLLATPIRNLAGEDYGWIILY